MEHVNKFTYKKTHARARAHTHKYLHCQNFYKCKNYKYLKQPNSEAMKVLLTHIHTHTNTQNIYSVKGSTNVTTINISNIT